MTEVRKGYCEGCPFAGWQESTVQAYNWGCLPSVPELNQHVGDGAWPCHDEPQKVCCGFAAQSPEKINRELRPMEGVHSNI